MVFRDDNEQRAFRILQTFKGRVRREVELLTSLLALQS
jgi:hypothetical protein